MSRFFDFLLRRMQASPWCRSILLIFAMGGHASVAHSQTAVQTGAAAPSPQILIVSPYGAGAPGMDTYIFTLQSTLKSNGIKGEDIFVEYLDLARNPGQTYRDLQKSFLAKKYGARPIKLIVTVLQPALDYLLKEGKDLAPNATLISAMGALKGNTDLAGRHLVLHTRESDYHNTLRQALTAFPATKQVLVIAGSSEWDKDNLQNVKAAAEALKSKPSFTYTDDLSYEEILDRVAALPKQTIVLSSSLQKDKTGRVVIPGEFQEKIVRTANAPVFVVYDVNMGHGAFGGSTFSIKSEAESAAATAMAILKGTFVSAGQVTKLKPHPVTMYDWQQIKRWGIKPDKLPADSVFINRPPSLWGQYRQAVIAAVAVFLVLSLLIVALSWQIRRKSIAEDALLASQDRYRTMIEEAPEAIMVFDTDLERIIDSNSKAERLLGRKRDTLTKIELASIYAPSPSDDTALKQSISNHIQRALNGESLVFERVIRPLHGNDVPCEVWLARLPAKGRNLLRVSFIDITERKKADAELRRHRDHLEEQVAERTDALSLALRQAQTANLAKSTFLSHMSHEIRTPMNAILGYTQLMQRMPELTGKLKNYTAIIARSSEHLLALINDVLEMSKIEAGGTTVQAEEMNLRALMKDVESMLNMRAVEKGLALTFDISAGIPATVLADTTKVRQILVNIIGNAVKFTDRGSVNTHATLQHSDTQSLHICIEIADTGPGIAEHEQSKVFDAFEQTESGHRKGGTGLGMAISRQYARLMGGDLTFSSVVGKGTTVRLTFAARQCAAAGDHVPSIPARRILDLAPGSPQPKILIADDVDSNRDVLRLMLSGIGFTEFQEIADGSAVLAEVQRWQPDIVLMDRRMPGMDGLQAIRAIRTLPQLRHIRIIMVTAGAFQEERHLAMVNGADGFVSKPFREEEILNEIQRLFPAIVYRYESDKALPPPAPLADRVHELDAELLANLVEMIECGDVARFERTIEEQVRAQHPGLHKTLYDLAQKFDYANIIAILIPATRDA